MINGGEKIMEFIEFTAKTVSDAITEACQKFGIPSSKLDHEVLEEGSTGFLGIGAKAAKIRARVKFLFLVFYGSSLDGRSVFEFALVIAFIYQQCRFAAVFE